MISLLAELSNFQWIFLGGFFGQQFYYPNEYYSKLKIANDHTNYLCIYYFTTYKG